MYGKYEIRLVVKVSTTVDVISIGAVVRLRRVVISHFARVSNEDNHNIVLDCKIAEPIHDLANKLCLR